MQFSAYPPPGSTDTEILYNQYKPFQSAWIVFLTALVVIVLSGMLKSSRTVFAAGLLITLAAIGYSAWGFALRVRIAGRPPVTNMYETVIWASFIVSVLGFWFCVLPFTWPGLSWAWRLAGMPLRLPLGGSPFVPELWSSTGREPRTRESSPAAAFLPVQCLTSVVRLAALCSHRLVLHSQRDVVSHHRICAADLRQGDRLVVAGDVAGGNGGDHGRGLVRLAGRRRPGALSHHDCSGSACGKATSFGSRRSSGVISCSARCPWSASA